MARPLTIAHFRRAFGAPSETFITEPIARMTARGISSPVFTLLSLDSAAAVPHIAMVKTARASGQAIEQRSRRLPSAFSKLDLLGWPLARRWIARELTRAAPDVLVSHFGPDGCLAAPVARQLGIPHIVFFYGYDVNIWSVSRRNVWSWLYPRLFQAVDRLGTTSHYLARRLVALGAPANKVSVVHAGVDLTFFPWTRPTDRFEGNAVRLLHVGRLTAKKSPLKLLQAVSSAQARCRDLRLELTIAGDGELADESHALAARLGMSGQVRFTGRVGRDAVRALLASHHLYTQYCETTAGGDTEGLGVSFIEASASGLPIVTTRHNGLPEVVLDGVSGLLSEEGDITAMGENIAALARDSSRWSSMGHEGRMHVERHFSLEDQVSKLLDLCSAVARGALFQ